VRRLPSKVCGGKRLQVKHLKKNIIEVVIVTEYANGENLFIPPLPLI
jgi:hypothetical protein